MGTPLQGSANERMVREWDNPTLAAHVERIFTKDERFTVGYRAAILAEAARRLYEVEL